MIVSPACISLANDLDGLFGRIAGGNHHPCGARRFEFGDEIFERRRSGRTFADKLLHGIGAQIGNNTLVTPRTRRRVIFAPILPRPTIPSCMSAPLRSA